MSKRGKTNYFKAVVSDANLTLPAAYAPVYCVQRYTIDMAVTSTPQLYVDGVSIAPMTEIADINLEFAAALELAFTSSTKWTVGANSEVVSFVRQDVTGNFPLIRVTDAQGNDVTSTYGALVTQLRGAKTAAEGLYNYFTTDGVSICFDTEQSYVNATAMTFGLQKSAKLEVKPDGEEDNNGEKESKITFMCNLVGLDDANSNYIYDALMNLKGTRKYVYLIDVISGLVKKAGPLLINVSDITEGNAKEKIEVTGEETGAPEDLYQRKQMILAAV